MKYWLYFTLAISMLLKELVKTEVFKFMSIGKLQTPSCTRNKFINSTHHSHIEKKIDFPEFNKAALIFGYLFY